MKRFIAVFALLAIVFAFNANAADNSEFTSTTNFTVGVYMPMNITNDGPRELGPIAPGAIKTLNGASHGMTVADRTIVFTVSGGQGWEFQAMGSCEKGGTGSSAFNYVQLTTATWQKSSDNSAWYDVTNQSSAGSYHEFPYSGTPFTLSGTITTGDNTTLGYYYFRCRADVLTAGNLAAQGTTASFEVTLTADYTDM